MSVPKTRMFIDGENVVARYQAMLEAGWKPRPGIVHEPDVLVWHPDMTQAWLMRLVRVSYYTSVAGDEARLRSMRDTVTGIDYSYTDDVGLVGAVGSAQLHPQVFKRPSKGRRSRQVDINITIDIMRCACSDAVEAIFLVSGDGDYIPLLEEVGRRDKEVWVAAFSSGLNPALRHHADSFHLLDMVFFESGPDQSDRCDDPGR